jgi:hypothetical protein
VTPPKEPSGAERRRWSRQPADTLPNVKAALKSGVEVELINLSRGGAQFRTPNRLLPGLNVSLKLVTADGALTVQGKVMRSAMVRMRSGSLGYEVGIAFDLLLMGAAPANPAATEAGTPATNAPEPGHAPPAPPAPSAPAAPPIPEMPEDLLPINIDPGSFELLDSSVPARSSHAGNVSVTARVSKQSLDGLIGLLDLK